LTFISGWRCEDNFPRYGAECMWVVCK